MVLHQSEISYIQREPFGRCSRPEGLYFRERDGIDYFNWCCDWKTEIINSLSRVELCVSFSGVV